VLAAARSVTLGDGWNRTDALPLTRDPKSL